MAKQNFLSGGFYGKLGAMVGQRWKNKRTIRTYVIPKNPNTPEQKRNRSNFAGAVQYAQMGMQMNYYCNLFDVPQFTKWNYRMSVARNLKFAGMTDLNLIPLYPTSFTPPLMLTEIKLHSKSGKKHITFSVPELTSKEDRVFSMMFALYNEQSLFRGYKLYLGYYYKDNPQFLEVDVDDVEEINSNCFVRLVTNDDQNSLQDMIASSKLAVKTNGIDKHEFNCNVSMVSKTVSGIKITFAEPWKENPTVNTVSLTVSFVSAGQRKAVSVSDGTLENNNGLCSVSVPYATYYNQDLPAFPAGSLISAVNVRYEGDLYEITITNGSSSYSDADITRSLDKPFSHNNDDSVAVSLRVPFSGTVSSYEVMTDYFTEGRFGDDSVLNGAFMVSSDGEYINLRAAGVDKNYPMVEANCYVTVPNMEFVAEGVTYRKQTEKKYFSNGVTNSTYLVDTSKTVDLTKERNDQGNGFKSFIVEVYPVKERYGAVKNPAFLSAIENPDGSRVTNFDFTNQTGELSDGSIEIYHAYTSTDPAYQDITEDSDMYYLDSSSGNVLVEYNGIYYDTGKYAPKASGWTSHDPSD